MIAAPATGSLQQHPGGIFRELHTSDWESANNGLAGSALNVNSVTSYRSATLNYGIAATADGVYMTFDNFASWQQKSNGLTGKSHSINMVGNFDSPPAFAATDSGFFVTTDNGENWITMLPSERFMTTGIANYPPTGLGIYLFGDSGRITTNFSTWLMINMTGITGGPVTDFVTTQNYIFVTTPSGGVFRKLLSQVTSVNDNQLVSPKAFRLSQNYPNPFNPSTRISYSLSRESFVSLVIYDILGREVATLEQGKKQAGEYSAYWSANAVPGGVYFYRLVAGHSVETKKMILMK